MWLGITIGFPISLVVVLIFVGVLCTQYGDDEELSKSKCAICIIVIVLLIILGTGIGGGIGAFMEKEDLKKDIASYQASKYTIEQSLNNEQLSGLERIELVKLANEKNQWLERTKYKVKQWYSFYLDKELVLSLEMIEL